VRYRVLGPLRLLDAAGDPVELGPKLRRLLAALLLHTGEVVAVDQLVEALWPYGPPADPRAALQVHVVRLRRHVGDALQTATPGYVLTVSHSELDAAEFERLVLVARGLAADGLVAEAEARLRTGLDLWRGDPVDGLEGPGIDEPRRRLLRLREQAEDEHAELLLALGADEELVAELEERITVDPRRARTWGQLGRALVAVGRPAAARDRLAAARAEGLDVPAPAAQHHLAGTRQGNRQAGAGADDLQPLLRALLTAARPHPLPTAVLQVAAGERPEAVEAALQADLAVSRGGPAASWRLRQDVGATVTDTTVDQLVAAALVVADKAREELKGPGIHSAAVTAAAVSPVLETALRDGRRPVEITATMGRWWSLRARRDLAEPLAAAVLDAPDRSSAVWHRAHGWSLDLARRAGDGRLVRLLVDSLPADPPQDPTAAALWTLTQAHGAEFVNDVAGAVRWFLDAADRWDGVGNGHGAAVACCNAAINAYQLGDRPLAEDLLARARSRPAAIVGPLPRHAVTMTEAHLCMEAGDFRTARDLALETEARLRGVVDRLADDGALLAAQAAYLRRDLDEARRTLTRCNPTIEGHNRIMAGLVRAEVECADGHPARAIRELEAMWADEGKLLRENAGVAFVGTYARLAVALGHRDLAAELLASAPSESGPLGRLDDELRDELGVSGRWRGGDSQGTLEVIGRARDELVAGAGGM
jgi:DNA-binding SARP family transcriptional activator